MNLQSARAKCKLDSEAVANGDDKISDFLHLPIPRSKNENQIYFDLVPNSPQSRYWLDIVEVLPQTSPRTWEDRYGESISYFQWAAGEPNNHLGHQEIYVHAYSEKNGARWNGRWNDAGPESPGTDFIAVCCYFLEAGAEDICPWLTNYQI